MGASERRTPAGGTTGPQQPSQAEGDRETVESDLREKLGDDAAERTGVAQPDGGSTPAARQPNQRPSQAEGERDRS